MTAVTNFECGEPSMSTAVVLVDDDDLFRESLGRNLADAGYAVRDFARGALALDHLLAGTEQPGLVILDWRMPEMNGIEVLKRIRAASLDVPAIFLTALTDQIYEEAALATGAVDFVEKSRSFSILEKRIGLILDGAKARGAANSNEADTVTLGGLVLRLKTSRATWYDKPVELTLTEFKIVRMMVEKAGEDVPYRAIYDLVHGAGFLAGAGPEGFRANVRTFVKRIRQKFRDADAQFDMIGNYAGFGYRWKTESDV
ncbi:MAG: response regulator transcription factor [Rhodospirillaceae bacterium]|nr:response regulator transcription factor [Rhodospirillales bacterium]